MADVLYAARGGSATTSNLYTVDEATAAVTSVGATGYALTGLAFDPTTGILYGSTSGNSSAHPKSLVSIDTATGAGTFIGTFGGVAIPDIAFDSAGQLYGWNNTTEQLVLINKATGGLTTTGASGLSSPSGWGTSFNSGDVLYVFPDGTGGNLFTVNTGTGATTNTGTGLNDSGLTHQTNAVGAAAFKSDGTLWALEPNHGILFTVNIATGVETQQGTLPAPGGFVVWDALAWSLAEEGGGDVSYPTSADVVGVSIAFDSNLLDVSPTWTRIDQDAVVTGWTIDRGRTSEVEKTGTGTATVHIIDADGTFDPTNSTSPFSGMLNPMTQAAIALYDPVALTWTTIFRGFVAEWLVEIDATETFFNVTLELVDALDVFARLQMQPGVNGIGSGPEGSANDVFFEGEPDTAKHVNGRINDALDNVSWPAGLRDIFSGNVTVRPKTYERSDSLLSVIQDAADAEFPDAANFYIDKTGVATFHGRYARFDPTEGSYGITTWPVGDQAATVGDTTVVPVAPISMRRSENDIINSCLSIPNGLTDDFVAADFVVEDAVSIGKYGYRSENFEDLLVYQGHDDLGDFTTSLNETTLFSTYIVDNYATPKTRVPSLDFVPRPGGTTNAAAWWGFVCGVEISDRVHLTTTHPGGGGFSEYFFVEGVHYDADTQGGAAFTNVKLTVDVSPASFYSTSPFGTVDGSIPTAFLTGFGSSTVTGSTA